MFAQKLFAGKIFHTKIFVVKKFAHNCAEIFLQDLFFVVLIPAVFNFNLIDLNLTIILTVKFYSSNGML